MMRLIGRFAAVPILFLALDPSVLAGSPLFAPEPTSWRQRRTGRIFDEMEQGTVIDALCDFSLLDTVTFGELRPQTESNAWSLTRWSSKSTCQRSAPATLTTPQ